MGTQSVPIPMKLSDVATLRADAILTATGVASGPIDVSSWRQITLLINYDPAATTDNAQILPLGAVAVAQPLTTDDVWYGFNEYDGSNTAATMGGTVLSGADFTITPGAAIVKVNPLMIRFQTITNAADEIRIAVPIRVDWCNWFQVQCWDVGSSTLANLEIKYTLST